MLVKPLKEHVAGNDTVNSTVNPTKSLKTIKKILIYNLYWKLYILYNVGFHYVVIMPAKGQWSIVMLPN